MFPFLPSLELNAERAPRTAAFMVVLPWLCMASGVMLLAQQVEQWCSLHAQLGGAAASQATEPQLIRTSRSVSMLKVLLSISLAVGGAAFTKKSFVWGPTVLLCLGLPVIAHMPEQPAAGSQAGHTIIMAACCFACIVFTSYLRRWGTDKQPAPAEGIHSHND